MWFFFLVFFPYEWYLVITKSLLHLFIYLCLHPCVFVCDSKCMGMCVPQCAWRSEDNLQKSVLFLLHELWGSKSSRQSWQHLLSHLASFHIIHNQSSGEFFFVLFCFIFVLLFETGFLCSFGACPRTCSVDQAGLKLTEIHLSLPSQCWD